MTKGALKTNNKNKLWNLNIKKAVNFIPFIF